MKKISVLKTIRILIVVMLFFQVSNIFFKKQFGEMWDMVFMTVMTLILVVMLIIMFGFGKKLEREKIEERRKKSGDF